MQTTLFFLWHRVNIWIGKNQRFGLLFHTGPASHPVQLGFEYHQRRRLHNPSGHSVLSLNTIAVNTTIVSSQTPSWYLADCSEILPALFPSQNIISSAPLQVTHSSPPKHISEQPPSVHQHFFFLAFSSKIRPVCFRAADNTSSKFLIPLQEKSSPS